MEELKDLRNSLTHAEQRVEEISKQRFDLDRFLFRRQALHYGIFPKQLNQRYKDIYHEIFAVCGNLADKVTKTTAADASRDAEYWDIASSGREPFVKKLLEVGTHQVKRDILVRMVLNYILGQVFGPMLVGLDRESESLLQGLQKNLESRMSEIFSSFPLLQFAATLSSHLRLATHVYDT